MAESVKTINELVDLGTQWLVRHAVPQARTACELLVAHYCACQRLELLQQGTRVPDATVVESLRGALRRVAVGEPVQYVIGEWEFRNLKLKVDKRALIPRPETEYLVELVLTSPAVRAVHRPLVVDVGTGSGCIILSLAQEMPDGVFVGLDISREALELACENACLNGLEGRVHFAESDGCGEFDPATIDLLVSNPPYISSGAVDKLERHIRDHEPRLALDGGADGLTLIRALLLDAVMVLKQGGSIFMEIGYDQGAALSELLDQHGFSDIMIHKDLAGKDRYASGVLYI